MTSAPEGLEYVPAGIARPPAPAEEVAGPPTSELVVATRAAIRAELALMAQARIEGRERLHRGIATAQSDSSGDALLELFSVPGGATGYLMRAVVDEAGTTPASVNTGADLWHAIYAASSPGITDPAQVVAVGGLMDFVLDDATAGQAKIPAVYAYGDRNAAPSLVGPATFYLVVDGATAARQIACRWQVLVERPEP